MGPQGDITRNLMFHLPNTPKGIICIYNIKCLENSTLLHQKNLYKCPIDVVLIV